MAGRVKRYQEMNGGVIFDTEKSCICYIIPVQTMGLDLAAGYMQNVLRLLNGETVQ